MKIRIKLSLFLLLTGAAQAQQAPSGTPVTSSYTTDQKARSAWYRGGNISGETQGDANKFGTTWNSPIYFITGGTGALNYRMKLNGNFTTNSQYPINAYTGAVHGVNASGYLLLGNDNNNVLGGNLYNVKGAFSQLHLNGKGTIFQEFGYRPWMKTGVTLTANQDLSYFGLRKLSTNDLEEDLTETVIMWSDNEGGAFGNDKLAFRFSGYNNVDQSIVSNDFNLSSDLDGRNVAQFTGSGLFGLGNTFGTNATGMSVGYIDPQSLMHMSYAYRTGTSLNKYGFMQITYRDLAVANTVGGFGETENDGLRLGIDNTLQNGGLNGYLRWQERTPFIIQTDWNNTAGFIEQGERMRISSTGAPLVPATLLNLPNTTRVSLSYLGSSPITQPRALLHLGANAGAFSPWMDNGMMVSNGIQTIYTGTTPGTYSDPNINVIGFGRNDLLIMNTTLGEFVRVAETTGNVGIGDFGPNGNILVSPTQKLDVDGNLRLRRLPTIPPSHLILGRVVSSDTNDIVTTKLKFTGSTSDVLLGNGTWGTVSSGGGAGYFGCSDPFANMASDSKFNLNNNSFYFEVGNTDPQKNKVGIGYTCGTILKAKLDVTNTEESGIAGLFRSFSTNPNTSSVGLQGFAYGTSSVQNIGLWGQADHITSGNYPSYGVYGRVLNAQSNFDAAGYFQGDIFFNGAFNGSDAMFKTNVQDIPSALAIVNQLSPKTYYMDTVNFSHFNFSSNKQYGFIAQELETVLPQLVKKFKNSGEMDSLGIYTHPPTEFKAVNYSEIIPINTQAIKELSQLVSNRDSIINLLNDRLTSLENCLSGILPALCQMSQSSINMNPGEIQERLMAKLEVVLKNPQEIVLNQNVPNPFAEQTTINFSIPTFVQKAVIHFHDNTGKHIKSVEIVERGLGSLTIYASDLSRGTYNYSLEADGKMISSKMMIKQ